MRKVALTFPVEKEHVQEWIRLAYYDCLEYQDYQDLLGGTPLDVDDSTTFWVSKQNF